MSFALPYMKDGRIHFFGTAAANTGDRVNDQNQTMFFLTEDISFDITN